MPRFNVVVALVGLSLSRCGCRFDDLRKELDALKRVNELRAAETTYYARLGRFGLLRDLGPSGAGLIHAELANGFQGGYRFETVIDSLLPDKYVLRARPVRYGQDGFRSFYSDQGGVVHETFQDEPATEESRVLGRISSSQR